MELAACRAWEPEKIRAKFGAYEDPSFAKLAYLDSAATSQRLEAAAWAGYQYERSALGNAHRGSHALAQKSSQALEGARSAIAKALGVSADCVALTSGATESANLLAQSLGALLGPEDSVYASAVEHHSNYLPWREAAARAGARFVEIPALRSGELDMDWFHAAVVVDRPRIIALTAMSNVTGYKPPIEEMSALAKTANPSAVVVVDAAQAVSTGVGENLWGGDWAIFSGHKMHAPSGVGVLAAREAGAFVDLPPGKVGGGMIRGFRADGSPRWASGKALFEAGSANVGGAVALAAAFEELSTWDRSLLAAHKEALSSWLADELARIPDVRVLGSGQRRGLVSFAAQWAHAHDIGTVLDSMGVIARVGHHCALPMMKAMDEMACVRFSFSSCSTESEALMALAGVQEAFRRFG